jgi:hypothetical protein
MHCYLQVFETPTKILLLRSVRIENKQNVLLAGRPWILTEEEKPLLNKTDF